MLRIRLRRMGAKKQPSYRVVVTESSAPRDGKFVEILGHYNPLTEPTTFEVNADKAREWIRRGAQPSDRVGRLLAKAGITSASPAPAATAAES